MHACLLCPALVSSPLLFWCRGYLTCVPMSLYRASLSSVSVQHCQEHYFRSREEFMKEVQLLYENSLKYNGMCSHFYYPMFSTPQVIFFPCHQSSFSLVTSHLFSLSPVIFFPCHQSSFFLVTSHLFPCHQSSFLTHLSSYLPDYVTIFSASCAR